MSIPVEILTMGASALLGGVLKVWGMSMESKRLQHQMMMEKFSAGEESLAAAREGPKQGNKSFQWTRRVIALSTVFSVIVLPKLSAFLPYPPSVVYAWGETVGDSWFGLVAGHTVQHWTILESSIVLTPIDIHATMAVIGLYMGSSVVGSRS